MLQEFLNRIGTFFILVAIGIVVLFIASDGAGSPNFDYIFWAMLSCILGFLLRRHRPQPLPSGRFSVLKRFKRPPRGRKER